MKIICAQGIITDILQYLRHPQCIVYTTQIIDALKIAVSHSLNQQELFRRTSIRFLLYHASLSPEQRAEADRRFAAAEVDVLVCTDAYGMVWLFLILGARPPQRQHDY